MTEPSIWDDPELQSGDNYFSFDNVGDTLQGRVEIIKRQVWADGSVSPQLFLTDPQGNDVILSAGQIRLKNELVAQRPAPGDDIWIRMTKVEPRGGGKTLKHFEVRVRRNNIAGYVSQFGRHGQQQAAGGWQEQPQPGQGFGGQQAAFPGQQQPQAQPGPQYGYQQQPAPGPGPFQQGQQPAPGQYQGAPDPSRPGAQQPPAQDPWATPTPQQEPAALNDPWATPGQQQPQPGGQPPF